jgi:folylpolyglutamate synthase
MSFNSSTIIKVLPSVEDAFGYVSDLAKTDENNGSNLTVFVTGSVHLVGRVLGLVEDVDAL